MTENERARGASSGTWRLGRTLQDLVRDVLNESDDSADKFLMESWLAETMSMLRNARRAAGLRQTEVARRLGMHQSAVARLESEDDTKLSTFWKYLAACDVAPTLVETVPLSQLRGFTRHDPFAPRRAELIYAWVSEREAGTAPGPSGYSGFVSETLSTRTKAEWKATGHRPTVRSQHDASSHRDRDRGGTLDDDLLPQAA